VPSQHFFCTNKLKQNNTPPCDPALIGTSVIVFSKLKFSPAGVINVPIVTGAAVMRWTSATGVP